MLSPRFSAMDSPPRCTVRSRLAQPQSVGYSSAGTVVAVGDGITDISVGDRVACAGAGYAVHGEFACVPRLLVAKIPESAIGARFRAFLDEAAFATVGAICLHGIRTADVALGETVAVIGLGLLGPTHDSAFESCRVPRLRNGSGAAARGSCDSERSRGSQHPVRAIFAISVFRKRAARASTRC